MAETNHEALILDQFTRQAASFSNAPAITDAGALRMVVQAARPRRTDRVVDIACGGGIVACAFAPHVDRVVGIDLTPAMLEQGRALAAAQELGNVDFRRGDGLALPYPAETFNIVVTRFSLHHFLEPSAALREMVRVCAPGGRVVVIDMFASEDVMKAAAWNKLEKLRDPSHVRCLALSELIALFAEAGLPEPRAAFYELRDKVENLLARSFPNPGDEARITEMFARAAEDDTLGIAVRRENDSLRYAYPVAILAATRH
jgi:ubiquinone/menaquinone biosynthesis C-methylase UbiE